MFPVGDFTYVAYLTAALMGLVIGAVSGAVAATILKPRVRVSALLIDALLGAGGITATSAMLFRLPPGFFIVPVIVAIILPILHELFLCNRVPPGTK